MRTTLAVARRAARLYRVPLGIAALLAFALTCQDVTVTPVEVRNVAVTPTDTTLTVGDELELTAEVTDEAGNRLTGRAVTWSSDDAEIVSVDATGAIVAVSSGETNVMATVDGRSGTATIRVMDAEQQVDSVVVKPAEPSVMVGGTVQLEAIALAEDGDTLAGAASWESEDPAVATVDDEGLVTGVAEGDATITATIEDVPGTAAVTVSNVPVDSVAIEPAEPSILVGGTVQLVATALAASGDTLDGREVEAWVSDDEAVATVDEEGLLTGESVGVATIMATIEGVAGRAGVTVSNVPVATVEIVPAEASVLVGDTVRLEAIALAENGDTLAGRMASWSSDETAVATVDAQGLVTGLGEGDARINATIEDASASVTVTVSLVPVASVEIVPADTSVFVGQTVQLAAIALSADGDPLEGRDVDWDSRDDDVATVDENTGLVTAVAAGTARIEAEIEDEEAVAEVTVSPIPVASVEIEPAEPNIFVGETVQLVATAFDADGEPLDGRAVEWTSDDPAVATVDEQGLVTGVGASTVKIMATIEDVSATAEVTVSLVPVASVVIEPPETSIFVDETVQLVVTALDADGVPLDGREVESWVSDDPAVAAVDEQGLVTGTSAGTATITATIDGVPGTAEVTVSLVPVASVVIDPADTSIFVGGTVQLKAIALAENGDTLVGRTVAWASSNEIVATVDDSGLVRGGLPGDARITATVEGVDGTANVTVSLIPVESVEVEPAESSIFVDETVQLLATALDANGEPLDGREVESWTSDNPAAATVDGQGLVTGEDEGAATITAVVENVPGTANVTVSLVPVASVSIEPADTRILVDETVQLVAMALSADGEPLDGREVESWTSTNPAAATVDGQGLVTGEDEGAATITAMIENVPGTANVTVSLVPVASVMIEPADTSIFIGGTVQLHAIALAENGDMLVGRAVSWASSNEIVATVDNDGLVRGGLLPGTAAIIATVEGVAGTANVTVFLLPVGDVEVESAAPSSIIGETVHLVATTPAASVTSGPMPSHVTGCGAPRMQALRSRWAKHPVSTTVEGKPGAPKLSSAACRGTLHGKVS